jgi:hypothetical protein
MKTLKAGDVVEWNKDYICGGRNIVNSNIIRSSIKFDTHQFHVKEVAKNGNFYICEDVCDNILPWLKEAFVKVEPRHEYKEFFLKEHRQCRFLGQTKEYDHWLEMDEPNSDIEKRSKSSYFYIVNVITGVKEGGWLASTIKSQVHDFINKECLISVNLAKNAWYII